MLRKINLTRLGLENPITIENKTTLNRCRVLKLSRHKKVETCGPHALLSSDLENVENRYLLTGNGIGGIVIHDLFSRERGNDYTYKSVSSIDSGNKFAHKGSVESIQWYPLDTGMFVTGSTDKHIKIWDTNNLTPVDDYVLHDGVYSHHLSPVWTNHNLLAVATQSPRVKLIDLKSGLTSHILRGHKESVLQVRWSYNNDNILASASADWCVSIWDVRRAKSRLCILDDGSRKKDPVSHNGCVNGLVFSSDGLFLVSVGMDGVIRQWDTYTWKMCPVNFTGMHNRSKKALSVTISDGKFGQLYIPQSMEILQYNISDGRCINRLYGHLDKVNFCVFNRNCHELYSGSNDSKILVWLPEANDHKWKCLKAVDDLENTDDNLTQDDWSSDEER